MFKFDRSSVSVYSVTVMRSWSDCLEEFAMLLASEIGSLRNLWFVVKPLAVAITMKLRLGQLGSRRMLYFSSSVIPFFNTVDVSHLI